MDYVFILDLSGSMAHDDKLNLSRTSIETFIETLEPEDRFEVLSFHVRPTTLFGSLQNANVDALSQAVDFFTSQRAWGGTVLDPDMHTAYQYADLDRRLNTIILSNGMTEQSERAQLLRLIQERPANATVFAIGVGNKIRCLRYSASQAPESLPRIFCPCVRPLPKWGPLHSEPFGRCARASADPICCTLGGRRPEPRDRAHVGFPPSQAVAAKSRSR